MTEAVIVPIRIDPQAGVAGLQQFGQAAQQTGAQVEGAVGGGGRFAGVMKDIARNTLQAVGIMSIMDDVTKAFVGGLLDAINGTNKLASSRKMLDDIQQKAIETTRDEVVQLQLLFETAKDTTLSYSQRQAAIDELNKKYPELHKNITLENVLTQQTADAIDEVMKKMVQKVQLQGVINEIAELQNQFDKLQKMYAGMENTYLIGDGVLGRMQQLKERIKDLYTTARELQGQNKIDLGNVLGGAAGDVKVKDIKVTTPKLKIEPKDVEVNYRWAMMDMERIFPGMSAGLAAYLQQQEMEAGRKKKYDLSTDKAASQGIGYDQQNEDGNKAWDEFINKQEIVASQVTDLLMPAFDGMFEAIFNNEDPLKAFFNGIGNSIKRLISQLAAAAIQAGVLSLLTGGAAKGGFSFAKAFGNIMGFAQGGLVTGPVSALVGEGMGTNASNPEVVAPLDKLKTFFTNFLIDGRYNTGRMGMSGSVLTMPREVVLRQSGRELVGVIALENISQGRNG